MDYIIGAGCGMVLGCFVGWFLSVRRSGVLREELARLGNEYASCMARFEEKESRLLELRDEVDRLRSESLVLEQARARLESDLRNERHSAEEKIALLQTAQKQLQESFRSLSAEALTKNNQAFLDLAQTKLGTFQKVAQADLDGRQKAFGELVKPIRESLLKVDEKLQQTEKERVSAYAGLCEQVRSMAVTQEKLQSETGNLVRALHAPSVRGRWGEMQLHRVVEMAGMLDHCDFEEQVSTSSDGGRLRPDMVVHLPGGKKVIVDAKTPLEAYLNSVEAVDDEARAAGLQNHARQVRKHIADLGAKAYWSQFDDTPEFVVMFLPGETFFSAALQQDPTLIEYGVDQRVIPASPTTLIALLRAVAYGWQQEKMAENARAISELGRELYDRMCVMTEHFNRLGKSLRSSVDTYNQAVNSLESRALVTARKFRELGAATRRVLPTPASVDSAPRAIAVDERDSMEDNHDGVA